MTVIEAVRWSPHGDAVRIIDQRHLPARLVERDLHTVDEICDAIRTLAVRGAPAIGICGAMGFAAALAAFSNAAPDEFARVLREAAALIRAARPTAVNLAWAVDRVMSAALPWLATPPAAVEAMRREASLILEEDRAMCRRIGELGVPLLPDAARILTHCNAGALATGGIGTALAPIYVAAERGKRVEVFATETRPLLQGSRLTAWELHRAGVAVTVLTDSMAASLMAQRGVDLCLVGADRIAANGDVANKIGTYGLAVLAHHHDIPFYVAVPSSTLDPATATGAGIHIERRSPDEVRQIGGVPMAPDAVSAYTPAFDVTPAALVTAIITDRGIFRPPYDFSAARAGAPAPR